MCSTNSLQQSAVIHLAIVDLSQYHLTEYTTGINPRVKSLAEWSAVIHLTMVNLSQHHIAGHAVGINSHL